MKQSLKRVAKAIPETIWRNEQKFPQTLILFPEGNANRKGYKPLEIVIEPGEEVSIPSEFDGAIHDVRDGVIVGGKAPLLTRVGGTDKLHFSLDVEAQEKKLQAEKLAADLMKKKVLEEALMIEANRLNK